jgi:hypothetical protein
MVHYSKLRGTWTKQGNEFVSPATTNFTLLLVERPNPKPKQPKRYILAILPGGQRQYVSGILESQCIDYQGKYFNFQMHKANEFVIV